MPTTQSQLRDVFDRFDTDKSGFIDLDELHAALATGGKRVTREETVKILADVDTNHDAKITFDEFESVFARASDALPPGLAQLVDVSKGLVDGLGGLVDGLAGFVVQEATPAGMRAFYEAHAGVQLIHGGGAAAAALERLVGSRARNRTLPLRDFYAGWEATGCQAHGGKPILLHRQPDAMQIFFDDHVTAHDAHIVDARRADAPTASPLPIAATLNVHLIKAEPIDSINKRSYFLDAIAAAENKWRTQAVRASQRV